MNQHLSPMLVFCCMAPLVTTSCGNSNSQIVGRTDEPDSITASDTSSDPASDSESASGSQTEIDTNPPPAQAGEACYTAIWPATHPNFGLADCDENLKCIGNDSVAFCSEPCALEGETNQSAGGFKGWCCGSPFDPCADEHYWLPLEMASFCIPRTAKLAEACDRSSVWTGDERRCAPICQDQGDVITVCAEPVAGTRLCTVACDILNGDADCILRPQFLGGCCGEAMGGYFCLTAELCGG